MSICLCGESAEKALDLIALKKMGQLGRAGQTAFETCRAGKRELRPALELLPPLERPVHLLVSRQELRVTDALSKSHVCTSILPADSLISLAPEIYVASPELNALLEMRGRSRMERALVIMGYCVIFAIDEGSEDGFVRRPQLTTVSRLREFAEQMGFGSHTLGLLEAARLALERARSPLEARLALALTAPAALGGLGIVKPELNATIKLGKEGRALVGSAHVDGDIVWRDQRIVIEANGRFRHEGRFGEDLTRASALESERYSVRFVTSQQLRSARQMLILGRWLARHLGLDADFPERERLQGLLNELLAFEYHRYSL